MAPYTLHILLQLKVMPVALLRDFVNISTEWMH